MLRIIFSPDNVCKKTILIKEETNNFFQFGETIRRIVRIRILTMRIAVIMRLMNVRAVHV